MCARMANVDLCSVNENSGGTFITISDKEAQKERTLFICLFVLNFCPRVHCFQFQTVYLLCSILLAQIYFSFTNFSVSWEAVLNPDVVLTASAVNKKSRYFFKIVDRSSAQST